jgi:hypothetical protein
MGRSQTEGFASAVAAGDLSLKAALQWHVQCNFFPPLPAEYANIGAIALADPDATITLPAGLNPLPRAAQEGDDGWTITGWELIASLRLQPYCEDYEG